MQYLIISTAFTSGRIAPDPAQLLNSFGGAIEIRAARNFSRSRCVAKPSRNTRARSCNLLTIPGPGDDTFAILLRYKRNSYHGSGVVTTVKSLHGRPRPFSAQRGLTEDEGAIPVPLRRSTQAFSSFLFGAWPHTLFRAARCCTPEHRVH